MISDNRGQFAVIVFSGIMICLFILRYIAHVSGTPAAIAAAVGGSMIWRIVKMRTEVDA